MSFILSNLNIDNIIPERSVTATDMDDMLPYLSKNIDYFNDSSQVKIQVSQLHWGHGNNQLQPSDSSNQVTFDIILASDVVNDPAECIDLWSMFDCFSSSKTVIILSYRHRSVFEYKFMQVPFHSCVEVDSIEEIWEYSSSSDDKLYKWRFHLICFGNYRICLIRRA